jgi:hypothetical protein
VVVRGNYGKPTAESEDITIHNHVPPQISLLIKYSILTITFHKDILLHPALRNMISKASILQERECSLPGQSTAAECVHISPPQGLHCTMICTLCFLT